MVNTLPGISAHTITTSRITTRVLFSGDDNGESVVFIHGNGGSGTVWEEIMLALPAKYRGVAPDMRGFGDADASKFVDATRGMRDFEEDIIALLDQLHIEKAHIVAHSGSGVAAFYLLLDYPLRVLSCTLAASVSPYGSGTKGIDGKLCFPDGAGAGGGTIPDSFMQALKGKSRGDEPGSGRHIMNTILFKPSLRVAREEEILDVIYKIHVGDKGYPGDKVPSNNWPFFAPGKFGFINAISGLYARDLSGLFVNGPKPPILWIYGQHDTAVQDGAVLDIVLLAKDAVPGYPGNDVFPPQPSLSQIQHVLQQYKESGGQAHEVGFDCGHFPFVERPQEFSAHLNAFLERKSVN